VACAARPPSERLILKRGPRGNLSQKTSPVLRPPPCAIGQGSPSCAHRSTKSPPRSGTNPGGELPVAPCLSQRGEAHSKQVVPRSRWDPRLASSPYPGEGSILAAQAKPRRRWRDLEASHQVGGLLPARARGLVHRQGQDGLVHLLDKIRATKTARRRTIMSGRDGRVRVERGRQGQR
jgi:hypothetical protein